MCHVEVEIVYDSTAVSYVVVKPDFLNPANAKMVSSFATTDRSPQNNTEEKAVIVRRSGSHWYSEMQYNMPPRVLGIEVSVVHFFVPDQEVIFGADDDVGAGVGISEDGAAEVVGASEVVGALLAVGEKGREQSHCFPNPEEVT